MCVFVNITLADLNRGRATAALATVLLLATTAPVQASVQGARRTLSPREVALADSIASAEFARDSVGGMTVGIVTGDSLVWTRSYGWADIATHRPATRRTVYRIGSITKTFTAVMLWQLVRRGDVTLDAPVSRWVPEISEVRDLPRGASSPTIMQLATMSAGLAREPDPKGNFWSGPVSRWDSILIAALPDTRYDFAPGKRYEYSNIGYAILGLALERAAHAPYVKWEQAHVLKPLGMTHSAFSADSTIASDVATGYEIGRSGQINDTTAQRELRTGRGYRVPNGALFTTVDDLARFIEFELGHGPAAVLDSATLRRQFASPVSAIGPGAGYGPGFMKQLSPYGVLLGHDGSVAGFSARMLYNREADFGIIVLRNATGDPTQIGRLTIALLRLLATKAG